MGKNKDAKVKPEGEGSLQGDKIAGESEKGNEPLLKTNTSELVPKIPDKENEEKIELPPEIKKQIESFIEGSAKREIQMAEIEEVISDLAEQMTITGEIFLAEETEAQSVPKKSDKKKSKITNFLRKIIIGTTLVLGIPGHDETTQEHRGPEIPAAQKTLEPEKHEGALREIKESSSLKEIKEFAEKCNFDFKIEVENGEGPYIIHMGQWHYIPDKEKTDAVKDGIIMSQKDIEKFILMMQEKNGTKDIFCEGFVKEGIELHNQGKKIKAETVDNIQISPENYHFLVTMLMHHEKEKNFMNKISGIPLNHFNLLKVKEIDRYFEENPPKFDPALENISQKERQEIMREFKLDSFLTPGEQFTEAKKMWRDLKDKGSFYTINEDAVYVAGANEKLFLEGKINMIPAEDKGLNETFPIDDPQAFMAWQKKREEWAIKSISESDSKERYKILLYGNLHDFGSSVEDFNKNNPPERKLGIIRLTPDRPQLKNDAPPGASKK